MSSIKVISYNINGIRAAIRKGFWDWLKSTDYDVICLQEIKATTAQFNARIFELLGYHCYWYSAKKGGYSGVAILSKIKPSQVVYGCGIEKYDNEGRILRADIGDLSIISAYFPSGSSGTERQAVKMDFLADMTTYLQALRKERPKLILSGDYNICHQAIDIHDPIRNKNKSGFLPEERAWMDNLIASGFVDTFRYFHPTAIEKYSWWSYRARSRERNKGWRIDYHCVTENLEKQLIAANILSDVVHADHCPVLVTLNTSS